MTTAAQPPPVKRFGWVKWALLSVLLVVSLPAGCTYWVLSSLNNIEATQMAVAEAGRHPAVIAKLGTPLTRGRFVAGSFEVRNSEGSADLAIPVSGPKGAGTLYAKATRTAGRWMLDQLRLAPDDGSSSITILGGGIRS
ncbi:MAG: cytochrome c oxidase assembly factor Coa1 family protein [Hyphomicrobiaceae bacterium]